MSLLLRRRTYVGKEETLYPYIEIENVPGTVHRYAVRKFGPDWFMIDDLCEDYDDGGVHLYEGNTFEYYSSNFTRFLNLNMHGYDSHSRLYSGFCMNYNYYNSGRRLFPAWLSVLTPSDITNLMSILGTSSTNWISPEGFNFYNDSIVDWMPNVAGANMHHAAIWINYSGLPTGTNSENVIRFFSGDASFTGSADYIYMQVGRAFRFRLKVTDESKVKYSKAYVPRPNW